MIINSQFFITYYTGKNPLPLKTAPSGLTPIQRADYEKFIQSIGSIYASQSSNGKIPKFWTQLTQVSDALGGTQYSYIPHPDSDLEYLSPKSSYYFIVRDEASIPLRVPSLGGAVLGFADANILPSVYPSSIRNITLTSASGNSTLLSPIIDNLQPYEEYIYCFKSVDANWPLSVNPESGILKPSSSSGLINSKASFCLSSGECSSNSLDYNLDSCSSVTPFQNDKYAIINLSIIPKSYSGPEILSNHFTMFCRDCLPLPNIKLTSTDSPKVQQPEDGLSSSSDFNFTIDINNLQPHQTYHYSMETIDAQWPSIFIGNASGSLHPETYPDSMSNTISLPGKLVFCYATGVCKPGTPGINPYTVPISNYPKFWDQPKSFNVLIRAKLVSSTCPTKPIYSDPILVSYEMNKLSNPEIHLNIDT